MALLEEYKASIVFTKEKRIVIGKKKFKELYKVPRTFDHLMIANIQCKDGGYKLDKLFCISNDESSPDCLKKVPDKIARYANTLEIKKPDGSMMCVLYIEFDISNFSYLFELTQVSADLLNDEKDEMKFDMYIYFVKL